MIELSFADLKQKAKWQKLGFDGQRHQMIVDGLNLAGFCRSKIKHKPSDIQGEEEKKEIKECGEYNVLPIGFVNTSFEDSENLPFLADIKKFAVKVNQGIITNEGIKKLYEYDHDHNKICPKCNQSFQLKWYEEAIFHNCKYRMSFKMNREDRAQEVEGMIAHQNKFAKFNQNLKECKALEGLVSPLDENEQFVETFLSWLWEHDL